MYQRISRWLLFILCISFFTGSSQDKEKADSLVKYFKANNLSKEEKLRTLSLLTAYSPSIHDQLDYAMELLDYAKTEKDLEYTIEGYLAVGVAYRQKGNLNQAFEYLYEGANQAIESIEYRLLLSDIYTEIATCYTLFGDSRSALEYGIKAIEIFRENGISAQLGVGLLNIGFDHYVLGNYESALSYYKEAEDIFSETDMPLGIPYTIGNRALVQWKQGKTDLAQQNLQKAIDDLKPFEDRYGISDFQIRLGIILLEENEIKRAQQHAESALQMALNEGLKEQIRDAHQLLFEIASKQGNYQQALNFQTEYYLYKDSIYNQETADLLANFNAEFDLAQKQAQVDLLLEQKRTNRIIIITGGIILLAVIVIAILIFKYSRSKIVLNQKLEDQKNDLVILNDTKDKFFSIISHDLRGPVNIMSGLAGVLKKDLDLLSNDEIKEMIEQVDTSGQHLVKLLDNLLHWALQQRGQLPYQPDHLPVDQLLGEVAEIFERMARTKRISIKLDIEAELTAYVDRNATSTIFRNLINNAIKFTNEGGKIEITARRHQSQPLALLMFSDSGVGIPPEKLKSLFEFHEDNSTRGTAGEKGLGLGLQLVYDFVKLNKGDITVESTEGKGTTFTLSLPTTEA
jgi:two-component system NtrC family sensor kinase